MRKNQTLNHISILFFSFVAILVVVNLFTTNNYGRANTTVLKMTVGEEYMFNYFELRTLLEESSEAYQLVDLRNEFRFLEGHLPGAVNIPLASLLDRSSLRQLRRTQGRIPVLYASSEADAQAARLLLLAKGEVEDIRVLGGNYQTAARYVLEGFNPAFAAYKEDKARFDYPRYMKLGGAAASSQGERSTGIIPAVNQETLSVQGGC